MHWQRKPGSDTWTAGWTHITGSAFSCTSASSVSRSQPARKCQFTLIILFILLNIKFLSNFIFGKLWIPLESPAPGSKTGSGQASGASISLALAFLQPEPWSLGRQPENFNIQGTKPAWHRKSNGSPSVSLITLIYNNYQDYLQRFYLWNFDENSSCIWAIVWDKISSRHYRDSNWETDYAWETVGRVLCQR